MHLLRLFRRQDDFSTRRLRARRRPRVEALEGRQLLSSFTVTNVNDSGAGSLRQAILSSNATTGTTTNTITFDVGSGGTQTIALKSALPVVTHAVVIDATTQPGTGTAPRVVLNGSMAGSTAVGLDLTANNSVVKGLVIDDFAGGGVLVSGASGDSITADYVGVNAADNATAGNGTFGIRLTGGSFNNSITHDVISGNATAGVDLNGASLNVVASDVIGTDVTGTKPLGNSGQGVLIEGGSIENVIGGTAPGAGDVISANAADGVYLLGVGVTGNLVEGNKIGTNVNGTAALGNGFWGVGIQDAAKNSVGGPAGTGAGNLISGNNQGGVAILFAHSVGDVVQGNLIGTDFTGSKPLGNAYSGVYVGDWGVSGDAASGALIGGTAPGDGNIISANGNWGVWISDAGTEGVVVEGNRIGTNLAGTSALGNAYDGVHLDGGASYNTIGGTALGAGNVISGNKGDGINLSDASHNVAQGNLIGINATGTAALGNANDGVHVYSGSDYNLIGAPAGGGNVISGNSDNGVEIADSSHNLVEGDLIGTSIGGSNAVGNKVKGVLLESASAQNTIGGTTGGARDVISANGWDGVHIVDSGTTGNLVGGDYIGIGAVGTIALGNAASGVAIYNGASGNVVGDTTPGLGDVISANKAYGVYISDSGTTGNLVENDYIGTDFSGSKALGNGSDGVIIQSVATKNTIGGTTSNALDVISANGWDGVHIVGSGTKGNVVEGSDIGTNSFGTAALANAASGVAIYGGASGNVVGGTTPGDRDIIAANTDYGVYISDSGTTGNLVADDFIGTDDTGAKALGNGESGVIIQDSATKNTVGGTTAFSGNIISGNGLRGIELSSAADSNLIEGNFIGTDVTGTKPLGNGLGIHDGIDASGILIDNGANSNIIGGSTVAARNIIAANGYDGVHISSSSGGTVVEGNYIGTDVTGTKPLGNDRDGVEIDAGATDNTIGASTAGARNVISYNLTNGVALEGAGKGNLIQSDTINDNGTSADRGDGVYIDDSPYTTVSYCLIESNWGWGVLVTSSSNSSVTYNFVLFNGLGNISGA